MSPMPLPSGPQRQSVAPASTALTDERATGSLLPPADSARDVAQEDFLFHLYRGSELLQENRVVEAKEELEFALTMQPLDAKGQDLLGAVYFRLGLYRHAIQIYEALEKQFSKDTSIKINLALTYLKTGQAGLARRPLEDTVRLQPEHKRAWGYLGLALQRLGELEQAQNAFERGGHAIMAKRVTERRRQSMPPASPDPPISPDVDQRVREMAHVAFSELDAGELRFSLAAPSPTRPGDGQWVALEPGETSTGKARTLKPSPPVERAAVHELVTVPPPQGSTVGSGPQPAPAALTRELPPPHPEPDVSPRQSGEAILPLLAEPEARSFTVLQPGVLFVRTSEDPGRAFAGRLDALRIVSGGATTRVIHRRTGDADTSEVLGGIGSPVVRVTGQASCVLGARSGHRIAILELDLGLVFVREDRLLAFELTLAYESERLALEHPDERTRPPADGVAIVQVHGTGVIALETRGRLSSVPSTARSPLLVRREWIVGWIGRLAARSLPPAEAPGGQRGLVGFSGEGSVLVCVE
jgi:Flp pilus assembly protein TadD